MVRPCVSRTFFLLWCILGSVLSGPGAVTWNNERIPNKSKFLLQTTLKTEITISTTTPPPPPPPPPMPSDDLFYRVNGSDGRACILLKVDALLMINYHTTLGEESVVNVYVPGGATVTGNCDNENTATMSLKWAAYVLLWSFAKTPGGERWYVDKIELTYNSSDKHFEHNDEPNKTIRLSTGQRHSTMLFPTPVGKSYACTTDKVIPLTDGKHTASVLLRAMKLQPFKFKSNDFAAEFSCDSLSSQAGRDETAPVAVGSTLAAVVLLTITGYAAYRYFKVKKVQYDTME